MVSERTGRPLQPIRTEGGTRCDPRTFKATYASSRVPYETIHQTATLDQAGQVRWIQFSDVYPLRHTEVDGMYRALLRPAAPRKERRRWRPVYTDR